MSYIKLSNFRRFAGPVIARRGAEYWKAGLVELQESDGTKYIATVHGSRDYTTEAVVNGDDVVSHSCNCPYSGTLCKHEVALLLTIKARLDSSRDLFPAPDKENEEDAAYGSNKAVFTINGVGLNERELFLLCFIATGGTRNLSRLSYIPVSVGRGLKMTAAERDSILSSLADAGIIRMHKYWSSKEYNVKEEFCYTILKELVSNHDSWLQFFKSSIHLESEVKYLLEVTEVFLGKRKSIENEWPYYQFEQDANRHVDLVLKQVILQEDSNRVLSLIKPDSLIYPIHFLIDDVIDYSHPERLDKLLEYFGNPERWDAEWHACYQHLRMVHFLAKGVLLPQFDALKPSSFSSNTDAVIALYENRLDDSIDAFSKGLSLRKGKKHWKYIPFDSIIFLLYVIALGRRRSKKDLETLRKILEFSDNEETRWSGPIFILAHYFQSSKQDKETDLLNLWLKSDKHGSDCPRVISALILAFFKAQKQYPGEYPIPKLAVLQCEMSAYGLCDKGPWPYDAALAQYKAKESWELELQELLQSVSDSSGEPGSGKADSARLAYLVSSGYNNFEISEIREQYRLKDGSWSKGRKLSYARYAKSDVAMDEIDRKIHDVWFDNPNRMYYYGLPSFSMALPYLIGTDKLLLETATGAKELTIREEMPFLNTTRDGDAILFGSNVPKETVQLDNGVLYTGKKGEWIYYPMNQKAKEALNRLLELKMVPSSAEPMLEHIFKALIGKLEIHSEIDGAVEMERVQGQQCMGLRITPEGSSFRAELHLNPLNGGMRSVFPGEGSELIYDSKDDRRFEVVRKLNQEKTALNTLNRLFSNIIPKVRFSSNEPEMLFDLSELLEVLDLRNSNENLFFIEWPDGKPLKLIEADSSRWEVSANHFGGWFELEGDIPLTDKHIVSMSQLLAMVRESSGGYIRLSENEYIKLSDSLRRQLKRIDALSQIQGNKVRVNGIAMAVSGGDFQGELEIREPESLAQMRRKIGESRKLDVEIPQGLNAILRDYQEDGVRWILRMASWGAGVCLADDMGLGKTLQTLACMLSLKDKGAQMVVAPASVVGNWRIEANRFTPSLNVVMLNELAIDARGSAIAGLGSGDLLVLTYGLLVSECDALAGRDWASVCLDEAHTIKNRDTKSSAAAMRLKSACRIILTGTPIQNHLGELWNLMQFINPGMLGSYEHFSERFIAPIGAGKQEAQAQLKRLIAPFLLRRTKQEVARELPDKEDITLPVSLSEEELSVYEVIRRQAKSELESSSTVNVNTLAMITKLREAACSASLVEKGIDIPSSKLSLMVDKLQQIVEQGNRVLVFSQFTSFLEMARKEMENAGITDYFYLNGSTPVCERQKMVASFQAGEKRVFLISLKAGGLGLNLTGANYVFHLDPWWNPAIEQQATDRAYRIGQKQKVSVYHLISEHTIEEKILRLHQSKRSIADALLQGSDTSHKLTAKELLDMIS